MEKLLRRLGTLIERQTKTLHCPLPQGGGMRGGRGSLFSETPPPGVEDEFLRRRRSFV
jgi:hypothetical protein